MLKKLVEVLVRNLVDLPDQVSVNAVETPRTVSLEVRVAAGDMGKVIGRGGRVARSIRAVIKAAAVKDGRRVTVEFLS